MSQLFKKIRGSLQYGSLQATWPFVTLTISYDELRIMSPLFSAILRADQVIELVKHRGILGGRYLICHNSSQIPIPLIFFGDCNTVDQAIENTGFVCQGIGALEPHLSKIEEQNKSLRLIFLLVLVPPILIMIYILCL